MSIFDDLQISWGFILLFGFLGVWAAHAVGFAIMETLGQIHRFIQTCSMQNIHFIDFRHARKRLIELPVLTSVV